MRITTTYVYFIDGYGTQNLSK